MPLYLDTVWLKDPTPARIKEFFDVVRKANTDLTLIGIPGDVKLVAGPWASNEEPKIVFVVDIPDHSATYVAFSEFLSSGLLERRRLEPLVEWSAVEQMLDQQAQ